MQFPFCEAVVQETLRLFPPGPVLLRDGSEDMQLGPHKIYKGSVLFTGAYNYQRDSSIWPEATSFKPQRFLPVRMLVYHF